MELNDPSIISATTSVHGVDKSSTTAAPSAIANEDLDKFFQNMNLKHNGTKDLDDTAAPESLGPHKQKLDFPNIPAYTDDYKPDSSISLKSHIYSINELHSYSDNVSPSLIEEITAILPKRKFWRLSRRFSDHNKALGARGNASGNQSGSSSLNNTNNTIGKGGALVEGQGPYGRRNSKSKSGKPLKKNAKNKKSERVSKFGLLTEEEMAQIDEDFELTGHSMADFEAWKAKMREIENGRKAANSGATETAADKIDGQRPLATTSSSISDFLKLNSSDDKQGNKNTNTELSSPLADVSQEAKIEGAPVGSSSRFSSFFTASNSSASLPVKTESPVAPASSVIRPEGGSKLLSLFKKAETTTESKSDTQLPQHVQQMQNVSVNQPAVQLGSVLPQSQNSNAFFQTLLNKGKTNDGNMAALSSVAPPPGMNAPSSKSNMNKQEGQYSQNLPMNRMPGPMGVPIGQPHGIPPQSRPPPGFPDGRNQPMMPPPGFPPFQGQMPYPPPAEFQQRFDPTMQGKDGQQRSVPQQMLGNMPPFPMPPPGFSQMQSFPPKFSNDGRMVPNGMAPPPASGFFSSMAVPTANKNMPNLPPPQMAAPSNSKNQA